jgi:hypothetical protein
MLCIRVGRRHTFYRALDLLTACAYRELLTYINEGNALTLDEVLKTGLRYSRDHHSAAQAFRAVHDDAAVCNHACPLCCKRDFSWPRDPSPFALALLSSIDYV